MAYMTQKGRVSEEIQSYLVSLTDSWEEMTKHPFGLGLYGPDSLQRSKLTGELYYFEFKWYESPEDAIAEGAQQVIRDYHKRPFYKGEPIKGAYVGWLDWNPKERLGNFHLKKVWPE